MDYKEVLIWSLITIEAFIVYIFRTTEKKFDKLEQETKEELKNLEKKIEKIETGEFVEKIVKNVIYCDASREYFKKIFNEVMSHKQNNKEDVLKAIYEDLQNIQKKLDEKK